MVIGRKNELPNESVVFRVRANPEPDNTVRCFYPYHSVLKTNSG